MYRPERGSAGGGVSDDGMPTIDDAIRAAEGGDVRTARGSGSPRFVAG